MEPRSEYPKEPQKKTRRSFLKIGAGLIVEGVALALGSKPDQVPHREKLMPHPTEFGFNTHLNMAPGVGENLSLDTFKKSVDLITASNQQWIRLNIQPSSVAPTGDTLTINWNTGNLAQYDEAVSYAFSKGLKTHLVVDVPPFAKDMPLHEYRKIAQKYHAELAQKYKGKIAVWQIFNEPDIHNYRDYGPLHELSDEYLSELKTLVADSNTVIKSIDPNVQTTVNVSKWVGDRTDLKMKGSRVFDAVKDSIDLITLDLYPDKDSREIRRLPEYVEFFKSRYGKDVIIGELGLPTGDGRFSPTDQQKSLTLALDSLNNGKVTPKAVMIYELYDEQNQPDPTEGSFGLLYEDGVPKNSYEKLLGHMQKKTVNRAA